MRVLRRFAAMSLAQAGCAVAGVCVEVGQLADVVHLHLAAVLAQFAPCRAGAG